VNIDPTGLNSYFFSDLAAGKDARRTKTRLARQTILGVVHDDLARFFVIYAWAGRLTAADFMSKILDVYEEYRPRRYGVEANGMQILFGSLIREEAKQRFGKTSRFSPIYQPTNIDKKYRIRTGLQPVLNFGRLFIQESQIELSAEIQGFPTAQTMDLIDSLETVINRVAPKIPKKQQKNINIEEYAEYLRNSGCPSHLIYDKVKQFELENIA